MSSFNVNNVTTQRLLYKINAERTPCGIHVMVVEENYFYTFIKVSYHQLHDLIIDQFTLYIKYINIPDLPTKLDPRF